MQFSKRDTLVMKGVAILFLVAYHCFSSVSRLNGYDVDFSPFSQKTAIYICESMNICVGMFAFLSSYGLTKTMKFKNENLCFTAKDEVTFVTRRILGLLGAFLMPYILCALPTLFVVGYNPYGQGVSFVFNLLSDMSGLSGFLRTPMLVGTWWYMSFAIVIILLVPITLYLYKKYGVWVLMLYVILPVCIDVNAFSADALNNMTRWLLTVPLGIIIADKNSFEYLKNYQITKYNFVSKLIKWIVLTIILYMLFRLRTSDWCKQYAYYFISSLLPVYFIYYLYEFIVDIPILNTVLVFLGKHSSNIFFMHTFIRAVWFKDFTYELKYAALIFAFMLATSLVLSFAVIGLKKLTHWDKGVKWVSDHVIAWEECLMTKKADT